MSSCVNTPDTNEQETDMVDVNEKEIETIYANQHFEDRDKTIVADLPLMSNNGCLTNKNVPNLSQKMYLTPGSSNHSAKNSNPVKSLSSSNGHVGIFLLGDGDALRGSDKVEDKNGTKSCPWTLSEQNSECGEENFGRADVLRPILTEEERKMLGVSPLSKIRLDNKGKEIEEGQDDEEKDLHNIPNTSTESSRK